MCHILEKTLCIALALTVFIWCVDAANVQNSEKGSEISNLYEKRLSKRSVRDESSSNSEENVDNKEEKDDNDKQNRESDNMSDDDDSSDSDGNRGISTKGLVPEDFEPERNPNIHERESKDSGSE